MRTFKEKSILGRRLAQMSREQGRLDAAARFEDDAALAERNGKVILDNLLRDERRQGA